MTQTERDWLLTAGRYAGAIVAIAAAVGAAMAITVGPMIAAERRSREATDDRIVNHLILISRDRIDLIELMRTPAGPEWDRKYETIKERWTEDNARLTKETR